jgi:hypothetical protein
MVLAAGLLILAWAPGVMAGCWTGNGVADPVTNRVEAQVWPGDTNVNTWMDFTYTTDGSDPVGSGTATTLAGTFFQFAGNNDWFEAFFTANPGDLVRWFVTSQSADLEICTSEEFQYVVGEVPETPPNLVGDCESELTGGGDWDNGDDTSKMWDPDEDGIFEVTLTALADFGGGSGYQVVGVSGQWSPQYPGDSNVPISFVTGEEITFFLDTNAQPGWSPESNAVYDSKVINTPHTWAAVGDWQGWDPANPATQMADIGEGIFCLTYCFDVPGTYQFKCAADGGWGLQCGANGYGNNCNTWQFDVAANQGVAFYLDTNSGRIMVDFTVGPSGTEDASWGSIKSMYK